MWFINLNFGWIDCFPSSKLDLLHWIQARTVHGSQLYFAASSVNVNTGWAEGRTQ